MGDIDAQSFATGLLIGCLITLAGGYMLLYARNPLGEPGSPCPQLPYLSAWAMENHGVKPWAACKWAADLSSLLRRADAATPPCHVFVEHKGNATHPWALEFLPEYFLLKYQVELDRERKELPEITRGGRSQFHCPGAYSGRCHLD